VFFCRLMIVFLPSSISGVAYGMIELIRRVVPRDIVGGDVQKVCSAV